MNRSRTLILLAILLLVGAGAVLVLLPQLGGGPPQPPTPTPAPVIPTSKIVVASQDIPRGALISSDAVYPAEWPDTALPPRELVITETAVAIGQIARTDILRGQPVLLDLITKDPKTLTVFGNDAALFIPAGKVAIAFPIDRLTSVGYSIGAGDHVDVLVSFAVVDANQDGQFPIVPFNRDLVDELTSAGLDQKDAAQAALQQSTSTRQTPRLLSQLTLQNVEVLHVGEWPAGGIMPQPTPTLSPEQAQAAGTAARAVTGGTPTATPPRPDMLILLVDQQQALILQWLSHSDVAANLVLRGAGDNAPVSTETVTYQYILTNFNITIPPKTNTIMMPLPTPSPQP